MKTHSVLLVAFVVASSAAVFACGGDDTGTNTGDGDGGTGGGKSESGGSSGTGANAGTGGDSGMGGLGGGMNAEMQGSPLLLSASLVLHGTMSIAWQNPDSTCETVEINRNRNAGDYSVAQTLIGEAMSAQDSPGHESGTYCYTVTCKLNDLSSPPSNEKCVTQ